MSNVNHPQHYQSTNPGGIECIDAMIAAYGVDSVIEFCRCNAFKYQWRAGRKGNLTEDIAKAQWYQDKMVDLVELTKSKLAE